MATVHITHTHTHTTHTHTHTLAESTINTPKLVEADTGFSLIFKFSFDIFQRRLALHIHPPSLIQNRVQNDGHFRDPRSCCGYRWQIVVLVRTNTTNTNKRKQDQTTTTTTTTATTTTTPTIIQMDTQGISCFRPRGRWLLPAKSVCTRESQDEISCKWSESLTCCQVHALTHKHAQLGIQIRSSNATNLQ